MIDNDKVWIGTRTSIVDPAIKSINLDALHMPGLITNIAMKAVVSNIGMSGTLLRNFVPARSTVNVGSVSSN